MLSLSKFSISLILLEILFFKNAITINNPALAVTSSSSSTSSSPALPSNASDEHALEALPQPQALVGASSPVDPSERALPVFPERPDAVYFVVAVAGGEKSWGRTLARTLLDMGPPFSNPQGPPLRPLYIDLPQNGR